MNADPLLQPFQLKHLVLRNRIMSTAHAPSFQEGGHPRDRYRLYHEEKAKGGVALTMVGGSTNIAPDSPSVFGQLYAGDDSIIPWFQKLTSGVKDHGAAVMCQITHMGRRTTWDGADWLPVLGPSTTRERAHRSHPKEMEQYDIDRVVQNYADAALRCQEGGFDGIELLAHSHLLGQFMSPLINKRNDTYGGSLGNRLRLMKEVISAVRQSVGSKFIVGIRITGDEIAQGGLSAQECVEIAKEIERTGSIDFLNVLAGAPYDDKGLAEWISPMGLPSAAHINVAGNIRASVRLPVFHAGGISDLATARHVLKSNLMDMVGMTRAHIADPHLVRKLSQGEEDRIRPCVGLGYCVDRVNQGKAAVCGHNATTGREARFDHVIQPAEEIKNVIIVGGGAGGLEAARVSAERGHKVILLEASNRLGGQLNLADKGKTRQQIRGVTDWLISEVEKLGTEVRMNTYVEADDIYALSPDLVIVATGGFPVPPVFEGAEHVISSHDVLSGQARLEGDVLLFDEVGTHAASVTGDVLAANGANVFFVTPDRAPLFELGPTTYSVALGDL